VIDGERPIIEIEPGYFRRSNSRRSRQGRTAAIAGGTTRRTPLESGYGADAHTIDDTTLSRFREGEILALGV